MKAICLGVLLVGLGAHAANIEPSPVEQPASDVPRVDSPKASLVQPLEKPTVLDARAVDLLGSAALKYGWSGGLKVASITSGTAALLLFVLGLPIAGAIDLAVSALCLSVGIVLDMSASNDLDKARQLQVRF